MSLEDKTTALAKRTGKIANNHNVRITTVENASGVRFVTLHSPADTRSAVISAGDAFTVPEYTVGYGKLQVYLDGIVCVMGADADVYTYNEHGNEGETSTTIVFHQDIAVGVDIYIRV